MPSPGSSGRTGTANGLRCLVKLLLAAAICCNAWGLEYGLRDPEFARVPIEEWLNSGRQDRIHWAVEIVPPELSTHQRMLVRILLRIDGRELLKRRGRGEFVVFFQYRDPAGHLWQNHTSLDLEAAQPGIESRDVLIGHYAFLLRGDYSVAIAIWDSVSGDHAVLRRKVHAGEVANDPLPEAWTGLPAVDFIRNISDTPDVWYLPDTKTKLHLPVNNERPVHVEILVNTTPSERNVGSVSTLRRNMSLLIPALKALTSIELKRGSIDVSLLDLTHRKVTFSQNDVRTLDWERMRKVFSETNPGVVDVATLQNQWKMRRFFWDELSAKVEHRHDDAHLVIVLSGPAFMQDQEPFAAEPIPHDPLHKLLYIRYRPNPARFYPPRRYRPGARPIPPPLPLLPMAVDDLEKTALPLNARLYDATSAEQFRRILASVIEQIGNF